MIMKAQLCIEGFGKFKSVRLQGCSKWGKGGNVAEGLSIALKFVNCQLGHTCLISRGANPAF
eukprot:1156011-Pelagomonas_calceolata.AAC.6